MKKSILIIASLLLGSTVFGQTTWNEIQTGTTKKLNAIDFPTTNVGYIVGEDSTILKSTDGGQTWQQLPMNGINIVGLDDEFRDIDFIDENVGFLVSGYSGIFRTSDGGQTWNVIGGQASNMCFPHCVFPFSGTDFFAGGAGCFEGAIIDHYQNGNWDNATLAMDFWDSGQTVMQMSFSDANHGMAATYGEYMLRTVDGGVFFDTIFIDIPGRLTSVVMVDDTLCYAGYEDPSSQGFGILKSEDGGLTWSQDINSATFYYPSYLSVEAASNGDIYSGGFSPNAPGGLIFETVDGVSWDYQNVDQPINAMTSVGSDITFGVGDSGYLVVNMPVEELSVTETEILEFTVYPNPISDELTIVNPENKPMDIRILDVTGSVVRTEDLQNGSSTINVTELNQGIYFVEVRIGEKTGLERIVKK
ncbi:MAG: YCF48-related protein [Crocinitomicaceae bacterium]|nr:YCF48-related protein [Crocinitomicaceae bacterium]